LKGPRPRPLDDKGEVITSYQIAWRKVKSEYHTSRISL